MTHSGNLPSRRLTKIANELGRLQRVMQERGGDLPGYVEFYKHTSTLPETTPAEYAERMYYADLGAVTALRLEYDRLQAERKPEARPPDWTPTTLASSTRRTTGKKIG